jgi:hypothetical protein
MDYVRNEPGINHVNAQLAILQIVLVNEARWWPLHTAILASAIFAKIALIEQHA